MQINRKIAIIGLGYVGLPLAIEFAEAGLQDLICYDIDTKRVCELSKHIDNNALISTEQLKSTNLFFSNDINSLEKADFYIITVPTPIDSDYIPNLMPLKKISEALGCFLKPGDIVVYESTVYPGTTEDVCIPLLEKSASMKSGKDFFVGYSPERVNVGDTKNTLKNTVKVIAAQNETTLNIIKDVYESIVTAGTYSVSAIKIAEATKLLENTQRDLNISLMNEVAILLHKLGLNSKEVIAAASTKWNFYHVEPGLVGGHCISVDPYYFTYLAQNLHFNETLITAARQINTDMGKFIVEQTLKLLIKMNARIKSAKIGIMGFTFKEDCMDIRNTRVYDIFTELKEYDVDVCIYDPIANKDAVKAEYGIELVTEAEIESMDVLIFTVRHQQFFQYTPQNLTKKLNKPGLIMDIKGIWDQKDFTDEQINYWCL